MEAKREENIERERKGKGNRKVGRTKVVEKRREREKRKRRRKRPKEVEEERRKCVVWG